MSARAAARRPGLNRYRFLRIFWRVVLLLVVAIGSVIFILPFVWMVSTSFKATDEVLRFPPIWIPASLRFENYIEPWARLPFSTYYKNTITVVALNLVGTLLSSSLVAFGFARLRFRGRNILFLILLSTMMLPSQVTLVPTYYLFAKLGWVNSLRPLIIPVFFGSAFNIFLLRQFAMTVPLELDDAAKIDGCGYLATYWRIVMPLMRPALGVIAIFQFTNDWNDFFSALIYLNSPKNFTIALGLRTLQSTILYVPMQQVMAMTLITMIPVLAVFLIAQRKFIQGIVITGVKG
ncbi:MAG: carbohydrate ABC transporter permease [Anaerolineae bacterium]|nr:carbohydrate ABC transporter permease [Anaerolineae bacterium]